ncbi:MAG: hypothetical protein KGH72_05420 [Candidatus Micrarchaeota archaeon]|nr:hypothetical protein [Candidatus Micrarchaeota archaeon]
MQDLPFGLYGYTIAVSLIAIMIAISGILIGLGYATNNKKFKEWGIDELSQSIVNGALVGSMMLLFANNGMMDVLITNVTLGNGISMSCQQFMQGNVALCLAYNYLGGTGYTYMGVYHPSIASSVLGLITALFGLNAVLGVIGSIGVNIFGFTLSFGQAMGPLLSTLQYLIRSLTTVEIGALVQSSVLVFISVGALTALLPVGLILRSFYPTRRLGGFIIAVFIGTYVVLPLSYVLNAFMAGTYVAGVNSTSIQGFTVNATNVKNAILAAQQSKSVGVVAAIEGAVSSLISSFSGVLNWLVDMLSFYIVYTFILPAFSVVLTAVSVRELSRLLGSETSFWILDIL